jgi:hypothetical protein
MHPLCARSSGTRLCTVLHWSCCTCRMRCPRRPTVGTPGICTNPTASPCMSGVTPSHLAASAAPRAAQHALTAAHVCCVLCPAGLMRRLCCVLRWLTRWVLGTAAAADSQAWRIRAGEPKQASRAAPVLPASTDADKTTRCMLAAAHLPSQCLLPVKPDVLQNMYIKAADGMPAAAGAMVQGKRLRTAGGYSGSYRSAQHDTAQQQSQDRSRPRGSSPWFGQWQSISCSCLPWRRDSTLPCSTPVNMFQLLASVLPCPALLHAVVAVLAAKGAALQVAGQWAMRPCPTHATTRPATRCSLATWGTQCRKQTCMCCLEGSR